MRTDITLNLCGVSGDNGAILLSWHTSLARQFWVTVQEKNKQKEKKKQIEKSNFRRMFAKRKIQEIV